MNVALVIIGVLILVASVVLPILMKWPKKVMVAGCVIALVLLVASSSFTIVPTGYTGVKTTFDQISNETIQQGFNFKIPFVQKIILVNNKQQDKTIDTQVWGETVEKTPVYASDVVVTYSINKDRSAWIFANVSDMDANLISDSIVSSAIKAAMVGLDANTVTNRIKIEPLIKEELTKSLNEKYGQDTITVHKVVVNQMDFEEGYNQAISEKSIARQNQEKQEIENKTAIDKANANKQVAITNAEAAAEAKKIAAEAEAEANQKIADSLNDKILESKFYEKWNGELPTVMGENAAIVDIGKTD